MDEINVIDLDFTQITYSSKIRGSSLRSIMLYCLGNKKNSLKFMFRLNKYSGVQTYFDKYNL